MLPSSPWTLLGLDPATATPRDLQRAYARLLKIHRPDEDPEAFQHLHQAYQTAKAHLENATPDTPAPPTLIAEPSFPIHPPSLNPHPPASTASLHLSLLDQAIAANNPDSANEALSRLLQATIADPTCIQSVDTELNRRADALPPSSAFTPEHFLRFLENEAPLTPNLLLQQLENAGDYLTQRAIADAILSNQARLQNPAAAHVALILAGHLAIIYHHTAESLLDFAYPHLPVQERNWLTSRLDYHRAIGHSLRRLEPEERAWWRSIVHESAPTPNWDDQPTRAILRRTGRLADDSIHILSDIVPESAFEEIKNNIRTPYEPAKATRHPTTSKALFIALAVAAYISLKVIFNQSNTVPSHYRSAPRPTPTLESIPSFESKLLIDARIEDHLRSLPAPPPSKDPTELQQILDRFQAKAASAQPPPD